MRRPQQPPRPPRREPERPPAFEVDEAFEAFAVDDAPPVSSAVDADDVDTAVDYEDVRTWISEVDAPDRRDPVEPPERTVDDTDFTGFGTSAARRFGQAPVVDIDMARPNPEEADPEAEEVRPARRFGRRSNRAEPTESAPGEDGSNESTGGRWRDVWRATRARRRALRSEMRRFTARSRRRRLAWIISLSVLVVVAGGSYAAAYSPLFAVEKITVAGATTLDTAALEQALQNQLGRPLAAIDTSEVKAALVGFPMVETYSLEARPPHDLVLRIVERTPVGVIASDAGYTLVDAAGVALSTTPDVPPGQPVISVTGGPGSDAFIAAGLVIRSLPDSLRPGVTAVSATTAQDVTLTLADTSVTVIWGGSDKSVEKARVLLAAMTARPPGQASTYDVSTPSAVVVR